MSKRQGANQRPRMIVNVDCNRVLVIESVGDSGPGVEGVGEVLKECVAFYSTECDNPLRWMPFKRAGFTNPILGHYRDGEPEIMDCHIKWAVEHGIDFFAIDWYYHYLHGPATLRDQALDKGLFNVRCQGYMKFCLMWCNEHKNERYNEEHMITLSHVLTDLYFC